MLDVSILTSPCCCWLCCVGIKQCWFFGWLLPMRSWHLSSWLPPKQLLMGKQWSNQSVKWIKSKLLQVKGLPNLSLLACCMVQILKFSLWRKWKASLENASHPAAKTVAWVQRLLLHYLFTYTYPFSLNTMSSNQLSTCNKDDKFRDHQQLTFEFFSRICLLIYPPSLSLLNRQIYISKFFQIFWPYKM